MESRAKSAAAAGRTHSRQARRNGPIRRGITNISSNGTRLAYYTVASAIMSDLAKYVGNAEMFPVLRHWHFFNHAGVSPLPKVVGDAMRKFATEGEAGAYLQTNWYQEIEKLRI